MAGEANLSDIRINATSSRFREFCSINPARSLHLPISGPDLTRLDRRSSADNQIPALGAANENVETRMGIMQCCCGRPGCAYLEHNNAALGGLEKDLETAARLGQALLDRHEAYVRDSQAEQARQSSYISALEDEKVQLQNANHKIVVENRGLLLKLEQLNFDFGESGKRVQELEHLLQDCEQEIRRLNGLTRKTQDLELKLLDMEREQAELTKNFEDGKTETRSTIARWRESERKVRELEQEVRKIEWAAKVDREKHEQIVARMERDRALERELGLSEGRLKATAAVQNMQHAGPQKQVVSNFVRDILQDNANLQAGIAELRELLQSSNDEVQNLREQVMLHQPVIEQSPTPQPQSSLSEELGFSQSLPKQVEREVHVHHHYHTRFGSKRGKTPTRKTPRKRSLLPSALSSSPASSGASTPSVRPQRFSSATAVPLNIHTSNGQSNRWSMQSTATTSTYLSSMASSPRSYFDRNCSIFDRIELGEESSRPTSPESFSISSPMPFKRREIPNDQALSVFEEEDIDADSPLEPLDPSPQADAPAPDNRDDHSLTTADVRDAPQDRDLTPRPSMSLEPTIFVDVAAQDSHQPGSEPFEPSAAPDIHADKGTTTTSPAKTPSHVLHFNGNNKDQERRLDQSSPPSSYFQMPEIRPSLRRSNSHDSLMSISGMDIHLAQHPPTSSSALRLLGTSAGGANKHHFAAMPQSLRQPPTFAMQPLAAVTELTATSRHNLDSMSSTMLALNGMRANAVRDNVQNQQNRGLIGTVGGWVSSKWGRAPTPTKSASDLRSVTSTSPCPSISAARFTTSPSIIQSSAASTLSSSTSSTIAPSMRSVSTNAPDILRRDLSPATTSGASSMFGSSFMGRSPGINQPGPIPGFAAAVAAKRTPTVIAPQVNTEVLKESLAERI